MKKQWVKGGDKRADGSLIFDTKLDSKGVVSGVKALGTTVGSAFGSVAAVD